MDRSQRRLLNKAREALEDLEASLLCELSKPQPTEDEYIRIAEEHAKIQAARAVLGLLEKHNGR